MRYHFPISVDMFDFLTTGRFDYLEIGQTAEMILQMFPAPECVPKGLLVKKGMEYLVFMAILNCIFQTTALLKSVLISNPESH